MDLHTATPVEFDTVLAAIYLDKARADNRLESAFASLHRVMGHKRSDRRDPWVFISADKTRVKMSDRETLVVAIDTLDAAAKAEITNLENSPLNQAVDAVLDASLALAEIELDINKRDAVFMARGGWARYFSTTGTNAHTHTSMNCSTCNKAGYRTQFGWNPELSGLSEAEAVKKLGPVMCTICYPSAPVEWTNGKVVDPTRCPGKPVEGSVGEWRASHTWKSVSYTRYGNCDACGVRTTVDQAGNMRKHKAKK